MLASTDPEIIFLYYPLTQMKLTVQLNEIVNAKRKLTMAMGLLAMFNFKITKTMLWKISWVTYKYLSQKTIAKFTTFAFQKEKQI